MLTHADACMQASVRRSLERREGAERMRAAKTADAADALQASIRRTLASREHRRAVARQQEARATATLKVVYADVC